MKRTFTFHTDPGHGWLECPMSLINELGIAGKISQYSYRRGNTAYLEEDGDASVLIEALKAKGDSVEFVERNEPYNQSFIRRLPSFSQQYSLLSHSNVCVCKGTFHDDSCPQRKK